jgi:phage protein D
MKQYQTVSGFTLKIGSNVFKDTDINGLVSLSVEDNVDMASTCQITIHLTGKSRMNSFSVGDLVSVCLRTTNELFSGDVTSVQYSFQLKTASRIVLQCVDASHRLAHATKSRHWNDMKDSDVASEVGAESGLDVRADDTSEVHKYILQRNETNISLLKRLAGRNNFQIRVDPAASAGGKATLLFQKSATSGQARKITREDGLLSFNISQNTANLVPEVIVRGWDINAKKEIVGTCKGSEVTKIGKGDLGVEQAQVFANEPRNVTDVPVRTQGLANEIAKAEMERIARQFIRGTCSIVGDDSVRAGTMIDVDGLDEGVNGPYYVVSTKHVLSPGTGYKTNISFCSNTKGS